MKNTLKNLLTLSDNAKIIMLILSAALGAIITITLCIPGQ